MVLKEYVYIYAILIYWSVKGDLDFTSYKNSITGTKQKEKLSYTT